MTLYFFGFDFSAHAMLWLQFAYGVWPSFIKKGLLTYLLTYLLIMVMSLSTSLRVKMSFFVSWCAFFSNAYRAAQKYNPLSIKSTSATKMLISNVTNYFKLIKMLYQHPAAHVSGGCRRITGSYIQIDEIYANR